MSEVQLKCGVVMRRGDIEAILDAALPNVEWAQQALEPACGMEEVEETVLWPMKVNGVKMPVERIAFLRMVHDTQNNTIGFGVDSLASAFRLNRHTFLQEDFATLLTTKSRDEAESRVLAEIKRFISSNL